MIHEMVRQRHLCVIGVEDQARTASEWVWPQRAAGLKIGTFITRYAKDPS